MMILIAVGLIPLCVDLKLSICFKFLIKTTFISNFYLIILECLILFIFHELYKKSLLILKLGNILFFRFFRILSN
jgi:hypothetical protein